MTLMPEMKFERRYGPDAAKVSRDADPNQVRAREWLNEMVRTDQSNFVEITPELATAILERNPERNRAMRAGHVELFMRALKRDTLKNTGDPIAFDWDGALLNGQHRAEAVRRTGISCWQDLRFGLDPAAFSVTDAGRRRTTSDALRHEGHTNTNALASAVQWAYRFEVGAAGQYRSVPLGPEEVLYWNGEFDGLQAAYNLGSPFAKRFRLAPAMIAGLVWHLEQAAGQPTTADFLRVVTYALGLSEESDPRWQLNQWLGRRLGELRDRRTRTASSEALAIIIKCWNAHLRGRKVRALSWRPGKDRFPDIEGTLVAGEQDADEG